MIHFCILQHCLDLQVSSFSRLNMKTPPVFTLVIFFGLQLHLTLTYGPHYLDYRNGSIIINRHMAYTYMGPGHTIAEQVSVLQTVSIVGMIQDILDLDKIVGELDKACHNDNLQTKSVEPPLTETTAKRAKLSQYVLIDNNNKTRFTPTKLEAICRSRGLQIPEPFESQLRKDLTYFLIQHDLRSCLIKSEFDWHQQVHISPATGEHMLQSYKRQKRPHHMKCAEVDYNVAWEFTANGETKPTLPKAMWRKYNQRHYYYEHTSRKYLHHPIQLKHFNEHGECKSHDISMEWAQFPLVCQRPNLDVDSIRRTQQQVQDKIDQEHQSQFKTIAMHCRESTKEGRHYAELTRDTFYGLAKRIGMSAADAKELLNEPIFYDQSPNPTVMDVLEGKNGTLYGKTSPRNKRSVVLKLVNLFGLLPFKIAGFLYQQHQFDKANQKMENIEKQLRQNSVRMNTQATLNAELSKEISVMREEIKALRRGLSSLATLVELGHQVNRLTTAVITMSGYLNVKLFTLDQLVQDIMNAQPPRLMETVADALLESGKVRATRLIPDSSAPAIALPGMKRGTIDLILNFVGVGETLDIYSIVALPQFDREKKVMYVRKPQFPYTAIDQNQKFYAQLNPRQAEQCIESPCIFMGARQEIQDDPCTVGPYIDVQVKADVSCPIEEFPEAPVFITTSLGIVFSLPFEVKAHLSCDERPGSEETYSLNGEGVLAIPPTCILHVTEPSLQFYGPPKQMIGTLQAQVSDHVVKGENVNVVEASVKARYELRSLATLNWTAQIRKVERKLFLQNKNVKLALVSTSVIIAVLLLSAIVICCESQKALNYAQARFIKHGFNNIVVKKPKKKKKGKRSLTARWRKLYIKKAGSKRRNPTAPNYDSSMDQSSQHFDSLISIDNRLEDITKKFRTIGHDHYSQNELGRFEGLHERVADDIWKQNESENADLIFSPRSDCAATTSPRPKSRRLEVDFKVDNKGENLIDNAEKDASRTSSNAPLLAPVETPMAAVRSIRPPSVDHQRYLQQVQQDEEQGGFGRLERGYEGARGSYKHSYPDEDQEASIDIIHTKL